VAYEYTHAGNATSEHLAKTAHLFEVYADDLTVFVDMGYQYNAVQSWADSLGQYHSVHFAPVFRGKNGPLAYEFGLNFSGTQHYSDTSRFEYYVYPRVNLQAEVLKRTLALYGGWDGKSEQHTLTSLIQTVPWLTMQQTLRLSGENKGYVGMQGALVGKLQYRVEASFALINDALQFSRDTLAVEINDAMLPALQVGYASNINRTSLRGELNLPMKNLVLSTYAQLSSYGGDDFVGMEGRVLGALATFKINELRIQSQLKYVGGRYQQPGFELEDYLDLNLNIGYEINENLSVSLKAYNLLNQHYHLYQGYGVRGTRGLFTLNYQF
jgi:hypothetical protein